MRQLTLQKHHSDALTLRKPDAVSLTLQKPGAAQIDLERYVPTGLTLLRHAPVSLSLQLVGDRPDTGADTVRIARVILPAGRSLSGTQISFGSIGRTISPATRSLSASQTVAAQVSRMVSASVRVAFAGQYLTGQVARSLSAPTRELAGYSPTTGAITRSVASATRALVATNTSSAFVFRSVGAATRSASAGQYLTASLSRTIASATRALTGTQVITGDASRAISSATRSVSATQYLSGAVSRSISSPSRAVAAGQYLTASASRAISSAKRAISAGQFISADISRSISATSRGLTATQTLIGAVSRQVAASTRELSGGQDAGAMVSRSVAAVTRSLSATQTNAGSVSRSVSATSRSLVASQKITGAITRSISAATRTLAGSNTPSYALPTVVGVTPFVSGTGAISPTFAATGRSVGDLLILAIESANQAITTPSGFTQASTSPQSTGTAAAAGGVRLGVFYKISDGTETTVSVADTGDHTTAAGIVIRGIDATTPINVSVGQTQAATPSVIINGVTSTLDNCLIVQCLANDRDATATNNLTTPINANLANLTKRVDATTASGVGGGVVIITGEKATAGATGNTTATNAASVTNASITLAIAPGISGIIDEVFFAPGVNPTGHTFSNGNKTVTASTGTTYTPLASGLILSGKCYVELTLTNVGSGEADLAFGISNSSAMADLTGAGGNYNLYAPDDANGAYLIPSGSRFRPGYTMANGDIWQVAYDQAAGTLLLGINDVWTSSISVPTSGMFIVAQCGRTAGSSITVNGGASAFAFTPPTGFTGPDT